MKIQALITMVALFAFTVVFANSRFVPEGWYLNIAGTGTKLTELQARSLCPGGNIPCAFHFSEGATTPDIVLFRN